PVSCDLPYTPAPLDRSISGGHGRVGQAYHPNPSPGIMTGFAVRARSVIHCTVVALSALTFSAVQAIAQQADADALAAEIARRTEEVLPRVVEWRRDIHQNPELSNREVRTAAL